MSDRKAELERKKAKLAQIRADKERRKAERVAADAKDAASRTATGEAASRGAHQDINKQLREMGITPVDVVLESLPATVAAHAASVSSMSSGAPSLEPGAESIGVDATTGADAKRTPMRKPLQLAITAVHTTSIPPKANETYSKQTQTFESGTDSIPTRRGGGGRDYYTMCFDDPEELYEEDSLPGLGSGSPSSGSPSAILHKLPPGIFNTGLPEVKDVKPATTREEEERKKRDKELSEEEKQVIMRSEDFVKFFDHTSRIVERALYEDINVFMDYTGSGDDGDTFDGDKAGNTVTVNRFFSDERWTKNRVITSMDWSQVFPELLVASYDKNPDSAADPDGVCLVWNTRFKKTTPEHIFHCQSQVMSATFARFHPNLILGGTYSGQIVLWDNRVQKRTPVQRSPLSASAHTHPVYTMRVVGTQNAHNLISISTDGKMCSWSLDMLAQPQETLELQQKQSKAVAVTCMSFPANDVNNFIVGSEEGAVYTACRHGSRAGILDVFEGHLQAPVTGLDTHPSTGTIDFGHLFLTSSMDWTLKLWSLKENRPLHSFEDNGDYVYDVAWSPIHPALFAAVDGTGRLDIWNLNSDTEVPAASVMVEGSPALNRVSWTQSGLHVTAGDDTGKIWVYDVGEQLALPNPDEWNKFAYTLADIKNNQTEEEFDSKLMMGGGGMSGMGMGMGAGSAVGPMSMGGGVGMGGGNSGPGSLSSLPSLTGSPMR